MLKVPLSNEGIVLSDVQFAVNYSAVTSGCQVAHISFKDTTLPELKRRR